jgi:ATP-binding cassette subfamily F protein uup
MPILLSCQSLSKSFGVRPLFENLSFGLFTGERTGLIGPNGMGKSTLLRILAGLDTADSGQISARRGLRVGYLAQRDRFDEEEAGLTVRSALAKSLEGLGLEDYEIDIRVDDGLERAGFPDYDAEVNTLSGGWRKRLAILSQVVREPDLLLLDEPTNHLDVDGVVWLEGFLSDLRFSVLMVTHDRRFLERAANKIMELDRRYEEGYFTADGNYSKFLEKREELFANQEARADAVRNIVRGEIEWLRKGPKARTTKQQARIDRAGELIGELEELDYRNSQGRATVIDFTGSQRQSKRLIEAFHVEKSLGGRRLFGPLDLRLGPGDKLGLLGENGSGKSTLLKVLTGELPADKGEVRRADALKIVSFDQHRDELDMDMPLQRALCGNGEHVEYQGSRIHVAGWASRFLFRHEQLAKPLRMLSGGEQSRVLIARLMLRPADLLLLDEPTNDLDLRSLEVLENSLKEFPGALILVTHDRYLLDRLSDTILSLDGKGGHRYFADLSQWETWKESGANAPKARRESPAPSVSGKGASPKTMELRSVESSIQAAEAQVEKAREALEDPAVAADVQELIKRQAKLDEAAAKVDELYRRWEELSS